jgi:hypothetical protein
MKPISLQRGDGKNIDAQIDGEEIRINLDGWFLVTDTDGNIYGAYPGRGDAEYAAENVTWKPATIYKIKTTQEGAK